MNERSPSGSAPPPARVKTNTPEQTSTVWTRQPFILSPGLRRTSGHKQANRASPVFEEASYFFFCHHPLIKHMLACKSTVEKYAHIMHHISNIVTL